MITLDDIREWYKHFGHLVTPEDVKDEFPDLYNKIYNYGYRIGYEECLTDKDYVEIDDYDNGYDDGYKDGFEDGNDKGYSQGYDEGYEICFKHYED